MRKRYYGIILAIVVLFGVFYSLRQVGDSRTFQFFGEIIPRVDTPKKVVALTFDDGPTSCCTEKILGILGNTNVKATFFVTGRELEQNLAEGQKIVAAGHELGNHSYSHARMFFVSPSFVAEEIESTDRQIRAAGYNGEIHFRPPYGKKLFVSPYYLARTNRKTITWDIEPESNPDIAKDSNKISEHILTNIRPGSIVLLHVMYESRRESLKAVQKTIENLRSQGYEFVTVSELLVTRNQT